MNIWTLVFKEISHRKTSFLLGVLSVTVATASMVGALTLLRKYDIRTNEIIALKEAQTAQRMEKMEDDYRKIMKKLGFNILIIPKEQNVGDLYVENFSAKYMPEEYVAMLSESAIMTINHLLPILQQKIKWPERKRTIIIVGTRGEVPIMQRDEKKPLLDIVPRGSIVLGYELHQSMGLSEGDRITLMGRKFTVGKTYSERGNKDDITAWINLKEAQELLGKKGKINAIMALECFCSADEASKIRAEVSAILPDVQVIELSTEVLVRAEARQKAADTARETIEAERQGRAKLRGEMEGFASLLIPLVTAGCALWIGFLMFANVRERSREIGVLRAFGMRSGHIFSIFLSKAVLMGILGVIMGYMAGFLFAVFWGEASLSPEILGKLFDIKLLIMILVLFPALSCIASWIPATIASQKDPAGVLREK